MSNFSTSRSNESAAHEFGAMTGEIAALRNPNLDDIDVLEKVIRAEDQNVAISESDFVLGAIEGIAEAARSRK